MTVEQTGLTSEMDELTRGQRLWQKVRDARETAVISLWRAKLMTASFKETGDYLRQFVWARHLRGSLGDKVRPFRNPS